MSALPTNSTATAGTVSRHWAPAVWTALCEGLPFAIASANPLRWIVPMWIVPGHPSGWQVLVPLGAFLIARSLHPQARRVAAELATLFPDPDAVQRRGPSAVLLAGSMVLVCAHIGASPPIAMLGLVVVAAGWALRRLGPFVLKAYAPAFLFLLLAIPFPHHWTLRIAALLSMVFTKTVAQLLTSTGLQTQAIGSILYVGVSATPVYAGQSLSGIFVIPATMAAVLCRLLMNRATWKQSVPALASAALIGSAANFLAVLTLALLVHQTGTRPSPTWRFEWAGFAVALVATELIARFRSRNLGREGNVP